MEDLDQNDEDLLSFFDNDNTKEDYDSADEILDFLDDAAEKAKREDSGKQSEDGEKTSNSVKEARLNRQKPVAFQQKQRSMNTYTITCSTVPQKAPPNGSVVGTRKTGKKEYSFNGITISEPKISLPILNHRVDGRKLVKISRIESTMINGDIEGDWVTIAVLVRKVTQKKSSSGKNFSVWHLSDMGTGTENLSVGFFLFGDVYKEHWKLQVGTIVGLLNPSIMKQEKDSWNQLSITIDTPKKLMEIGISRDLGVCKGVRKSDNKPCCMFINKNYGDYCEYHVQRQFKKAKHQRTELQSGGVGPEVKGRHKGNLMHNIRKDISQGNVYYGGRTVFLGQQKNQPVKMESLKQKKNVAPKNRVPMQSRNFNDQDIGMKETQLVGGTKDFKQLLDCPTVGSRNLLHLLKGNQIKEEETTMPKPNVTSAKDFLFKNKSELLTPKADIVSSKCKKETVGKPEPKMHNEIKRIPKSETNKPENQQRIQSNKKVFDINFLEVRSKERAVMKNSTKRDTGKTPDTAKSKFVPKLGRGFSRKDDLFIASDEDDDLNYNVYTGAEEKSQPKFVSDKVNDNIVEEKKAVPKVPTSLSDAKKKAIALIKQQGQIKKEDPNELPGKSKKRKSEVTMERVERSRKEDETERPFAKKKKGLLANVLGEIDINSSEGKKILNQKSRNIGELELVEAEREEKYFNSLERKEQMENKMSQIFDIKVKGVACKICGYLSDSRSKFCIDEQHQVAHIPNVIKKFFKCKHCQNRCYSFNRPIPKEPCRRCGERDFVKAPMADERKGPKLGAETLLLRGEERKYLNSLY